MTGLSGTISGGQIGARHVVVGFNHHFGKDRKGTFESLQKSAKQYNIQAEGSTRLFIDDSPYKFFRHSSHD